MKTYFIIPKALYETINCSYVSFNLKSYIVNNENVIPDVYTSENPMQFKNPTLDYYPSKNLYSGNPYSISEDNPNTYNPFVSHFGLNYNMMNGVPYGASTGSISGSDYGPYITGFGVDKPLVYNANRELSDWVFFIDLDYTQDFMIEIDLISFATSINEQPIFNATLSINHDSVKCISTYLLFNKNTNEWLDITNFGFLNGLNPDQLYVDGVPVFGEVIPPVDLETKDTVLNIECSVVEDKCPIMERTRAYGIKVLMPDIPINYDDIFKECCYKHIVLADLSNNADYRNDYSGFYYHSQGVGDYCFFKIKNVITDTEIILTDSTYGQLINLNSSGNRLYGFKVEWRKVLNLLGEGEYQVIKMINLLGSVTEVNSITFSLRKFSTKIADKSIRIDVVMNGWIEKDNINFKGINWKHSLRLPGFFGRREPKYEEDILVRRNFVKEQISMKQTNEYKLQTNMIPDCLTKEIFDFILYANDIYINDYNLNNHSYEYVKFGVKFSNNDNTEYFVKSRKARLNLTFTDRLENNIKRNY